jgi:hypothetical protein
VIEAFWIPLLPPYLIGLALSFVVEALLTPRPVAPWRRPVAAVTVHLGVWTLAFALELALFRRPYFAIANVLAIELLLVLVSNAKFHALREPFIYPDFEYFSDALRHPRLYLPFFGVGRALAAGGGYGAALWAGLALEDSVTAGAGVWLVTFADLPQEHMFDPTAPTVLFFAHTTGLALAGLAAAVAAGRRCSVAYEAELDLHRLGLLVALWAYRRGEGLELAHIRRDAPFSKSELAIALPVMSQDIVVIQSESFFDARRAYPGLIRDDVLANFDAIKSEAISHGQLKVPAWGANTVRTEFAFLSGMKPSGLGVHQYNPYRKLAAEGFPTIASYLKSLGYRTVCVHPYHRNFYNREKVLPMLGFEEFIGIEEFKNAKCDGPYVGDKAVAEWVAALLRRTSAAPLYVHVITMENHGPLHWERVEAADVAATLNNSLPSGCQDLVAYARHLRNADAMFGTLRQAMKERSRSSLLCIFGDHVPIMRDVYEKLGESDGATDYVLWASDWQRSTAGPAVPRNVSDLARTCLELGALHRR